MLLLEREDFKPSKGIRQILQFGADVKVVEPGSPSLPCFYSPLLAWEGIKGRGDQVETAGKKSQRAV